MISTYTGRGAAWLARLTGGQRRTTPHLLCLSGLTNLSNPGTHVYPTAVLASASKPSHDATVKTHADFGLRRAGVNAGVLRDRGACWGGSNAIVQWRKRIEAQ